MLMMFMVQPRLGLLAEISNLDRQIIWLDFYGDVSGTVYRADELLLLQQLLLGALRGPQTRIVRGHSQRHNTVVGPWSEPPQPLLSY